MSRLTLSRPGSRGFVRSYLWTILAVTLLTTGAAVAAALARPAEYVAMSQVVVYADATRSGPTGQPDMGTERELATSGVVAREAANALRTSPGAALDGLNVSVPVDANVLQFGYSAPTAERARAGAAAFTQAYVEYRNKDRKTPLAEVITPPVAPDLPEQPNLALVIGLGVVLGGMLGVAVAYLWDRVRDRLRDHSDITRQTELPVLASLPTVVQQLPVEPAPGPPAAFKEVFGYLAAHLTSLPDRGRGASIVVTSPSQGAGKTTVAAHLAIALAAAGKEVVLVGGDTRRPTVHTWFGMPWTPGLTDVLAGLSALERALVDTRFHGLRLLPTGRPGAPGFDIEDIELLIGSLATRAFVVIDAPSATDAADAALLASRTDFVVLVIDAQRGSRSDAAGAVAALKNVGGNLIGCVANAPHRRWYSRKLKSGPAATPAEGQPTEGEPVDEPPALAKPDHVSN